MLSHSKHFPSEATHCSLQAFQASKYPQSFRERALSNSVTFSRHITLAIRSFDSCSSQFYKNFMFTHCSISSNIYLWKIKPSTQI